jgi:hypothetical protein
MAGLLQERMEKRNGVEKKLASRNVEGAVHRATRALLVR